MCVGLLVRLRGIWQDRKRGWLGGEVREWKREGERERGTDRVDGLKSTNCLALARSEDKWQTETSLNTELCQHVTYTQTYKYMYTYNVPQHIYIDVFTYTERQRETEIQIIITHI